MPTQILNLAKAYYVRMWYTTQCTNFDCQCVFKTTKKELCPRDYYVTHHVLTCPVCGERVVIGYECDQSFRSQYPHEKTQEKVACDDVPWYYDWKYWFGGWKVKRFK